MAMDYLDSESEEVKRLFGLLGKIEKAVGVALNRHVPSIGSERYMSGNDVCNYLGISPRTLQTLRGTRQIPFTVISGRIMLYPEAGIREMLNRYYRPVESG